MTSPRRDGSTHLLLDPLELIEKMSVLIPSPRFHLLRFHGVLAPHAGWRSDVIPRPLAALDRGLAAATSDVPAAEAGSPPPSSAAGFSWSALLTRVFALDVLLCPRCGGRRRIVAVYTGGELLGVLLERLGLSDPSAATGPSRSPPGSAALS